MRSSRHVQQDAQILSHRKRVLGSRPDGQRIVAIIGDGARGTNRAVHLIGPDVRPLMCSHPQARSSTSPRSANYAAVQGFREARLREFKSGCAGGDCQTVFSCLHRLGRRAPRASATTPTKSPMTTTRNMPGISSNRYFIDEIRLSPDMLAVHRSRRRADAPRGREACREDGRRGRKVHRPVAFGGISTRGCDAPTMRYCERASARVGI